MHLCLLNFTKPILFFDTIPRNIFKLQNELKGWLLSKFTVGFGQKGNGIYFL